MATWYTLSLQELMGRLQHHHGAILRTEVASGVEGIVSLHPEGQHTFRLLGSMGTIATGNDAYDQLKSIEIWCVDFSYQHKEASRLTSDQFSLSPMVVSAPERRIPRRKQHFDPTRLMHFPGQERVALRMVWTHVDGHRSIHDIVTVLHLSADRIEQALKTLHDIGALV